MKAAFNKFDKDSDKSITINEIKQVFSSNAEISSELMDAIVKEADVNGDGDISFSEF